MRSVVDASVVAKWFIPELHKENAERILRDFLCGRLNLCAPDLLIAEIGNILWKRCAQRGEITPAQAATSYRHLLELRVRLHPSAELASLALELAIAEHRSLYDMLYLALAEQENCEFVTADEKLFRALGSSFPRIRWIGDV
jgi:predicted nucleic acid-binding protein